MCTNSEGIGFNLGHVRLGQYMCFNLLHKLPLKPFPVCLLVLARHYNIELFSIHIFDRNGRNMVI